MKIDLTPRGFRILLDNIEDLKRKLKTANMLLWAATMSNGGTLKIKYQYLTEFSDQNAYMEYHDDPNTYSKVLKAMTLNKEKSVYFLDT